jgi:hypothetical protein
MNKHGVRHVSMAVNTAPSMAAQHESVRRPVRTAFIPIFKVAMSGMKRSKQHRYQH